MQERVKTGILVEKQPETRSQFWRDSFFHFSRTKDNVETSNKEHRKEKKHLLGPCRSPGFPLLIFGPSFPKYITIIQWIWSLVSSLLRIDPLRPYIPITLVTKPSGLPVFQVCPPTKLGPRFPA